MVFISRLALFGLCIRHLQHTGAIAGFGLIAMDGKILVYLRAVIVEGVLCTVQRYICIRHKPLFVAITEDLVERAVQHFFHRNPLHFLHFRIAIAKNEILPECPVATTVSLIGSKWKLLIIRNLLERPWRFNELKKNLEGISQKVLTDSLRSMENDGLIIRTVFTRRFHQKLNTVSANWDLL